jgi:hypothetical protein
LYYAANSLVFQSRIEIHWKPLKRFVEAYFAPRNAAERDACFRLIDALTCPDGGNTWMEDVTDEAIADRFDEAKRAITDGRWVEVRLPAKAMKHLHALRNKRLLKMACPMN